MSPSNKIIGVINWFAVHPTSMNNTNRLISSDNVGYASILMEKALNGNKTLPGKVRKNITFTDIVIFQKFFENSLIFFIGFLICDILESSDV